MITMPMKNTRQTPSQTKESSREDLRTTSEPSSEDVQALLYQYQMLKAQAEILQKQGEMMNAAIEELNMTIHALEDTKNYKKGDETFVALGSGAFVRGSVGDTSSVLVNIGADVLRKTSVDKAIEIMEKRKSSVESSMKKLTEDLSRTQLGLASIEPELEKMVGKG